MEEIIEQYGFAASDLYHIAKGGYRRSLEAGAGNPDALIAIIFSCATLEAYINQAISIAGIHEQVDPKIKAFADIVGDMAGKDSSVTTLYHTARWVLTSETFDRGLRPYQDFALLVRIRNALIHLKPDRIINGQPEKSAQTKLLEELQRKGLTEVHLPLRGTWTIYLHNPEVAKWACDTASQMIQSFWKGAGPKVEEFFSIETNAIHYAPIGTERTAIGPQFGDALIQMRVRKNLPEPGNDCPPK